VTATVSNLIKAAVGASHALKSYANGNGAPDLAHSSANALDQAIQAHVDGSADRSYLVWSSEHRAWLRPALHGYRGYTKNIAEAGRYSRAGAMHICRAANLPLKPGEAPFEVPVPEEDAIEAAGGARVG
jgi:hypothetical protein